MSAALNSDPFVWARSILTLWTFTSLPLAGFVTPAAECAGAETKFAVLVVDYGDGAERRFNSVPWEKGLTVLGALQFAQEHPHGIEFEYRGRGATALLVKIDDLANQGLKGRNWIYSVNQKKGDRSFAVYELNAGDTVLWKFDTYP